MAIQPSVACAISMLMGEICYEKGLVIGFSCVEMAVVVCANDYCACFQFRYTNCVSV
jgi:hypothetical protein